MSRKKIRNRDTITCKVKEFRLAKGWSQEELAKNLDIRRQAVYDIESGRYLPNTAIALRLARLFGCRVEDLFIAQTLPENEPVHVFSAGNAPSTRLALARVRDRLIGLPLKGTESISFGLQSADGLLNPDKRSACLLAPPDRLDKSIFLMGCDPAFEILASHVTRLAPEARVHCRFASSHAALRKLSEGMTHLAATHLHNAGKEESNVVVAKQKLTGVPCYALGFSIMEEGLMVARGNPRNIRSVVDLAQTEVRFVNREAGAALRVLLDDHLQQAGIDDTAIEGYGNEVLSHREGAYRIACKAADAALGLKVIADIFGLDFVPLAAARCDLVIPEDLTDHPTVGVLLDVLQSARLKKEIDTLAGYESTATGDTIARW
jgi:molybdate-binding protein/DNA-binding XRE family transcriptional regulator